MRNIFTNAMRRSTACVASLVLAASLAGTAIGTTSSTAYADETGAADVTGYVTGASTRPFSAGMEILGISTVENGKATATLGVCDWATPKFYLIATDYNINPNPYFYNNVLNVQNGNDDAQPTGVQNDNRVTGSKDGDPCAALNPYGVDETDDAVWELLPDIIGGISGTDGDVDYNTDEYAGAVSEALGVDYNPIGVKNVKDTVGTLVDTVYNYAVAADTVVEESDGTKMLRYGDAMDIAINYEKYVRGSRGYILSQLAAEGKDLKTVACVTAYDAESGTFTLNEGGVQDGTATQNRYLEVCQGIAYNLADTVGTTVTRDQLEDVDLILIRGEGTGGELDIAEALGDLAVNAFYINGGMSGVGSLYGVVANSTEIAQNCGRIYGCLYPEYISQSEMIAYYYDQFYHIKSDELGEVIGQAMDGVRNWKATTGDLLDWNTYDIADYRLSSTQEKLDEGVAYIASLGDAAPSVLQLTDYMVINDDNTDAEEPSDEEVSEPEDNEGTETTPTVSAADVYSDVNAGEWYTDAITEMLNKGLMTGYGNTDVFGVGDEMNRAEFVTILWRYAEPEEAANYDQSTAVATDAVTGIENGAWYTGAANWAVENGVISGINGDFAPFETLTFDQMMKMIASYLDADASSTYPTDNLSSFADANEIQSWAAPYLAWAVDENLASGNNGYLYSTDTVLRERAAQVMANAYAEGLF